MQEKYKLSKQIYLKFILNLLSSYQSLFYSWNEIRDSGKCPFGKQSFGQIGKMGNIYQLYGNKWDKAL